jgi:hypothetical protein
MQTQDAIKKELELLVKGIPNLIRLSQGKDMEVLTFNEHYQNWYTRSIKLVALLGPDRLSEFVGYYQIDPKRKSLSAGSYVIQDFIMGIGPAIDYLSGKKPFDPANLAALRIFNQGHIIEALSSRIDSVLSDVMGHLLSEIEDAELEAASKLMKISVRAAGALAGVVLERHLQRVAANHMVLPAKKNPTIADLNDPLKNKGVYELATWRKITLMADIRNLCSHQKSVEPTGDQVNELIIGVNTIIKTVF